MAQLRGFAFVFVATLGFVLPTDLAIAVAATTGVRVRTALVATALGTLPGTIAMVVLGATVSQPSAAPWWIGGGAVPASACSRCCWHACGSRASPARRPACSRHSAGSPLADGAGRLERVECAAMEVDPRKRVALFLHSGDYDKLHQAASIAASATAAGRDVQIFFFWWALDQLLRGGLAEPSFREGLAPQATLDAAEDAFESGYPTAAALLEVARSSGKCVVYACSASAGLLGRRPDEIAGKVDQVVGWTAILSLTSGVVDRFYL